MMNILIADDDVVFKDRLSLHLKKIGCLVDHVSNGEEALEYLLRHDFTPDVIVMNLVMPIMDGWRFREIQRKHTRFMHIPVIAVASAPIEASYKKDLDLAAFFKKPVNYSAVGRAICSLYPRKAETGALGQPLLTKI